MGLVIFETLSGLLNIIQNFSKLIDVSSFLRIFGIRSKTIIPGLIGIFYDYSRQYIVPEPGQGTLSLPEVEEGH